MFVTTKPIEYHAAPYGAIALIPEGTPVTPATNLPEDKFWASPWEGMTPEAESWARSYGFLLDPEEVKEVK